MKAAITVISCLTLLLMSNLAVGAIGDWKLTSAPRMDPKLVQVCLYQDKSTRGIFSQGKWKALIGETPAEGCNDRLGVDFANGILVVSIPGFLRTGGYLAGRADAYCPQQHQPTGYSPCTSSFFSPSSEGPNYKVFNSGLIGAIGEEAGLFVALDKMKAENLSQAARKEREQYLQAFTAANTLAAIANFETKYNGNDPDNLINTLAPKKIALQRARQRELYASAKTANDYASLISEFSMNDLEGLLPLAKTKLADAERREAAESSKSKKNAELEEFERQIRYCVKMTAQAEETIERENQIGRVSGYVNKAILRQAGETIVMCRENNPKIYAEYQSKGGRKTLTAIGKGM